jgi:hypothetical protein
MKKIINECLNCPSEMGCIGDACPNKHVARFYCDECGAEEILYYYEDEELCLDCLTEKFDKVDCSDWW